jgi:tetratricopeptide (TPR) repeat protein
MRPVLIMVAGIALLPISAPPTGAQAQAVKPTEQVPATPCDTYAALDADIQRRAPGVPFGKIETKLAIPACESAVQQYPSSGRLIFQLGRAYKQNNDVNAALVQYRKAAASGYAPAQTNLAYMYQDGEGVEKDDRHAFILFHEAAEQGYAPAEDALGFMYDHGRGVSKDVAQAFGWYRKAAEQEDTHAQTVIGLMYQDGDGIDQDSKKALYWLGRAAALGDATASLILRKLSDKLQRVDQKQAYQRVTFEQFLLDGKLLAEGQARVSIKGRYVKFGEIEYLFSDELAVLAARHSLKPDMGVPLLIDDASREFRKVLLYCDSTATFTPVGCPVAVFGHVEMCEKTSLAGTTHTPCLAVENGDGVAP